mmetsp:Transcript_89012/g.226479  ORF Transcript_89012/g.226479 Transcript_89012/m.226479 type:complete len:304 (+) Transcript_89012:92-1003(+)
MASGERGFEDLVRGGGHGQRLADLLAQVHGQPDVLLLVLQREIRSVVSLQHLRALEAVQRRLESALLQDRHDVAALQACLLAERQALAEGLNVDGHDHIDDQLHAGTGTHFPQEEGLLAHHVEARLGVVPQGLVACSQDDELAADGRRLGAADGGLEEEAALRLNGRGDFDGALLVDGGHVDVLLARRDSREHAALAEDHLAGGLGVGGAGEDDVAGLHDGLGRVRDLGALGLERVTALLRPVPQCHIKAGVDQAVCHGRAHDTHAEVADRRLRHVPPPRWRLVAHAAVSRAERRRAWAGGVG